MRQRSFPLGANDNGYRLVKEATILVTRCFFNLDEGQDCQRMKDCREFRRVPESWKLDAPRN